MHVLTKASEETKRSKLCVMGTGQMLLAMYTHTKSKTSNILRSYDSLSYEQLTKHIIDRTPKSRFYESSDPPESTVLSTDLNKSLENATRETLQQGLQEVTCEYLLLGILLTYNCIAVDALRSCGIDIAELKSKLVNNKPKKETLLKYASNMNEVMKDKQGFPISGRDKETERLIQILLRKRKSNPCLVGEPGVGKTAIVEGFVQRILEKSVPEELLDVQVWSLELSNLLAGTSHRGEFEKRLTKVIEEAQDPNIILFIDELHTVIGAGSGKEGSMDASNMLKPALARGEISLIGATTNKEYKYIEKDAALERRMQKLQVDEPDHVTCFEILKGVQNTLESHHNVKYTDESIWQSVVQTSMYITDRFLPDKAIDVLDEIGSKKNLEQGQRIVTVDDINSLISEMTGVRQSEGYDQLQNLKDTMKQNIVGQDHAIDVLSAAIKRQAAGIRDKDRPIACLLMAGPTGVGKTLVAKSLANAYYGSESAMVRIDMSEYMESHNVSRLIGAPPGYIGYDEEEGMLTGPVRRRPYSLVLLDEVEKAHPDILNLLLQVFEDGFLTDSTGKRVNFRNTIVMMTSNLGFSSKDNVSTPRNDTFMGLGNHTERADNSNRVLEAIQRFFRPELLNRLDEIIVFNRVTRSNVETIASNMLSDLKKRIQTNCKVTVDFDASIIQMLVDVGFSHEYGARPLRRSITDKIEDPISDALLSGKVEQGDRVILSVSLNSQGLDITHQ